MKRTVADDVRPLVLAVVDELKADNERRIRSEIEERHRQVKHRLKLRKLRHELWEQRQYEAIEKEAKKWARAEQLRRYIARISELSKDYEVSEWLTLARRLIDDLDPISSETFANIVDLPKYAEVEQIWNERRNRFY